ncbi:MAG: hypothetical protein KDJ47_05325 [Hyphomicrobiaceae bacterium]|nr:hypothetical protein [Hyphomicrobiaceae bacterium]
MVELAALLMALLADLAGDFVAMLAAGCFCPGEFFLTGFFAVALLVAALAVLPDEDGFAAALRGAADAFFVVGLDFDPDLALLIYCLP